MLLTCPSDLDILKSKVESKRGKKSVYDMLGKILYCNKKSKYFLLLVSCVLNF